MVLRENLSSRFKRAGVTIEKRLRIIALPTKTDRYRNSYRNQMDNELRAVTLKWLEELLI